MIREVGFSFCFEEMASDLHLYVCFIRKENGTKSQYDFNVKLHFYEKKANAKLKTLL